jgi:transmembrane sensor
MDGQKERILILLAKFERGEASEPELDELDKWYQSFERDVKYTTGLSEAGRLQAKDNLLVKINNRLDQKPAAGEPNRRVRSINLWPRIAIAAILLICLSVGGYFLIQKQAATQQTAQVSKYDIAPGGNKAILTLANGKQIILTGARNGKLATAQHTAISKVADGLVAYKAGVTTREDVAEYNTMTTPKGGQYTLMLADGTKVILNAASSITYPTNFRGNERRVKLTGEAYFEVAHNKASPFHVNSNGQDVEVLGTHFNINSYNDEPYTRTTLLEGSVKINNYTILKPGDQSALNKVGNITVAAAETDEAVAWKNGKFVFQSESIESIMRKLARWYDADVIYQDRFENISFSGSISRSDNISKILNKITFTSVVHFKIEGRRIIVSK